MTSYVVARPLPKDADLGRKEFESHLASRAVAWLTENGYVPLGEVVNGEGDGIAERAWADEQIEQALWAIEYSPTLVQVECRDDNFGYLHNGGSFVADDGLVYERVGRKVEFRDDEYDYVSVVDSLTVADFQYENLDSDREVYVKVKNEVKVVLAPRKDFTPVAYDSLSPTRQLRANGLDCDEFHWRRYGVDARKFGPVVTYTDPDGDVHFRCYGTNNSGCQRSGTFSEFVSAKAATFDNPGWDVLYGYDSLRTEFAAMILSHPDRCLGRSRKS